MVTSIGLAAGGSITLKTAKSCSAGDSDSESNDEEQLDGDGIEMEALSQPHPATSSLHQWKGTASPGQQLNLTSQLDHLSAIIRLTLDSPMIHSHRICLHNGHTLLYVVWQARPSQ